MDIASMARSYLLWRFARLASAWESESQTLGEELHHVLVSAERLVDVPGFEVSVSRLAEDVAPVGVAGMSREEVDVSLRGDRVLAFLSELIGAQVALDAEELLVTLPAQLGCVRELERVHQLLQVRLDSIDARDDVSPAGTRSSGGAFRGRLTAL